MITRSAIYASSVRHRPPAGEDGHRYFELSTPFLSHAPPRHPARTHARKEPRSPVETGSRPKERLAGHLTRASADPGHLKRHK